MRKGRGWLVRRAVGELERDLACAARREASSKGAATWPIAGRRGVESGNEAAKCAGEGRRDTFFGVAVQP